MNKMKVLIGCAAFCACIYGSVCISITAKEISKDRKKQKVHKLTKNISYTIEPDITCKKK